MQEKLDAPKGATMSPSAFRVWTLLFRVAQRLREAIVSHYRKLVPEHVDAKALVTAVACSKLTVAETVPAAATAARSAKAAGDVREALMRAWPVVMAQNGCNCRFLQKPVYAVLAARVPWWA